MDGCLVGVSLASVYLLILYCVRADSNLLRYLYFAIDGAVSNRTRDATPHHLFGTEADIRRV